MTDSTPALTFAPLAEEDLGFLLEVRNECRRFLHDDREFTLEACTEWFRGARPDFYLIRLNGVRIGYFRLSQYRADDRSIYVGADLHYTVRGQGLGKAAYQQFLPWLATHRNIAIARLEVLANNAVAHSLYLRLGFVEVKRLKDAVQRHGASVDSIVMEKAL